MHDNLGILHFAYSNPTCAGVEFNAVNYATMDTPYVTDLRRVFMRFQRIEGPDLPLAPVRRKPYILELARWISD